MYTVEVENTNAINKYINITQIYIETAIGCITLGKVQRDAITYLGINFAFVAIQAYLRTFPISLNFGVIRVQKRSAAAMA
jgi:hypothetical protein